MKKLNQRKESIERKIEELKFQKSVRRLTKDENKMIKLRIKDIKREIKSIDKQILLLA